MAKDKRHYTAIASRFEESQRQRIHGISYPGSASSFWEAAWREGNLFVAGADWLDNATVSFDRNDSFSKSYQ